MDMEPTYSSEDEKTVAARFQADSLEAPSNISFSQKAEKLLTKLNLFEATPRIEDIIGTAYALAEHYQLPESFLDDEINASLLLGCSQKLIESTDPEHRKRIKRFLLRMIAPESNQDELELTEISESESSKQHLKERKVYVESHREEGLSDAFTQKHSDLFNKAIDVWKTHGFDLSIKPTIIRDSVTNFKQVMRAAGLVDIPDHGELPPVGNTVDIELILPLELSEVDAFVRHELYHVIDYWNNIRRGFEGEILESLDELHTEWAVGNYQEDQGSDSLTRPTYLRLKQFWDKLSYTGGLDFDLLASRHKAISIISSEFGLDGLIDFTLLHATGNGAATTFETYYSHPERPLFQMLISREKLNFRRMINGNTDLESITGDIVQGVNRFTNYCTPHESQSIQRFNSVYDLIPSKNGKVYSSSPIDETGGYQIENSDARQAVVSVAQAIAYMELVYQQEIPPSGLHYKQIMQALAAIPHKRKKANFDLKEYIAREMEIRSQYVDSSDVTQKDILSSLYYHLVTEMPSVDFIFSLQNPAVKDQILTPFLVELDELAQYCIDLQNPEALRWFADGLYRFNTSTELREISVKHLKDNFSELKPLLLEKESVFISSQVANINL